VSPDPAAIYQDRLAAPRSTHTRLDRLDARFAQARLGVFGLAVVTGLMTWRASVTPWILLAPGAAFLVLVVRHDRVIRNRDAAARAIAHYERGLARIGDPWIGTGEPGTRFRDEPYAEDLDFFGAASLFELLSTARTREGEEALAGWLLSGAPPDSSGPCNSFRNRRDSCARSQASCERHTGIQVNRAGHTGTDRVT
jgi:hypothetical protein